MTSNQLAEMNDHGPGMIAVPAQEWVWTQAITALWQMEKPEGSAWNIITSPTPIAAKRNLAVRQFLEAKDLNWLLFVDSDMAPQPDALARLLARRVGMVSALAFMRYDPFPAACGFYNDRTQKAEYLPSSDGTLMPMDWHGAAFLLLRRNVLDRLPKDPFVDNRQGYGEDLSFCLAAKKRGIQPTVDTSLVVDHINPTGISTRLRERLLGLDHHRGVR